MAVANQRLYEVDCVVMGRVVMGCTISFGYNP
jgi:hypothetical protein